MSNAMNQPAVPISVTSLKEEMKLATAEDKMMAAKRQSERGSLFTAMRLM